MKVETKIQNTRRRTQLQKTIEKPQNKNNQKANSTQSQNNTDEDEQEQELPANEIEITQVRRSGRVTRQPLTEQQKKENLEKQRKLQEQRRKQIEIYVKQFKKENNLYTQKELQEIQKEKLDQQSENQDNDNDNNKNIEKDKQNIENNEIEEEIQESKMPNLTMQKAYSQGLKNQFFKQDQKKGNIKKSNTKETHQVKGRVGLRNLGNTCYQNSVIQFLSNIQPLSDYCSKELYKREINLENNMGSYGLIATAFANLINEIWETDQAAIEASNFHKIISYTKPMFGNYTQEDAQEFLIFLLDYLHEDLNRVQKKPFVEEKEFVENLNQKEQEVLAADTWRDYLLRNKSVIIDLFQGQLKNSITCKKCKFSKYKFEPFMYLSLPLDEQKRNQRVKITDCLNQFIQEEELKGDEQWFCPKCNKKTDSIKKIDLWKLPNILMIMFKRFRFDSTGRKIDSCIEFQAEKFLLKDFVPQELQKEQPTYDLISALCHRGTLYYGHYYCYAKNKENFEWYEYNDSKTKCIQNPEKQIAGSSVYMLMYQKVTNQLIRQQSITDPKNWPHKQN